MKKIIFISLTVLLLASCGTTVKRVDSGKVQDLSGYWNARDVKIACDALINDCLANQRVDQIIRASGNKKPVVIVGRFRNESSEQLDASIISSVMENSIFNSGKLDFVADNRLREELRAERLDQQSGYVSDETAAKIGKEIGAGYMMTGAVRTIVDREGNRTVRTYYVTAELTNIETNARIWMGQNSEISKVITRPRNSL
ncbi:MAG: penicillin-binding protein activator LpoB [Treponema sp.]|nr:penicillin-binding protein activator LpoB [Treponema sp.]